jgi:hypothetical protein
MKFSLAVPLLALGVQQTLAVALPNFNGVKYLNGLKGVCLAAPLTYASLNVLISGKEVAVEVIVGFVHRRESAYHDS